MRKLRTQQEIMAVWKGDIDKPVVSIICTTYNHESFVEDAIEGFLSQETNFAFEILIHDDASTDNTASIIRNYQAAYPEIIKPVFQIENQYSRGERPFQLIGPYCSGHYIAVCEGDDYWTDPKKLQVQVDFLEQHPDYVISGHDACIVDELGTIVKDSKLPDKHKRDYSSDELQKGKAWVLTLSWVYRNILKEYPPERKLVQSGDKFFTSQIGHYGKSHFHSDIKPAVYRVHSGGIWSSLSEQDKYDSKVITFYWMYRYYCRLDDKELAAYYRRQFIRNALKGSSLSLLLAEFIVRLFVFKRFIRFSRNYLLKKLG